jgi:hypothetical protein
MNLDVMISLAFLSYYRYSFLGMDFLIFLTGLILYSYFTYRILPTYLQSMEEKKRKKYEAVRNILSVLLGTQLICYLFLFLLILPYPSIFIHLRANMGFVGMVYVLMMLVRVLIIILWSAFFLMCWFQLDQKKLVPWYLVLFLFVVYSLMIVCFLLFPAWNKALAIYEIFYNIRNLFLTKDPAKKEKTMLYLQSMGCIPNSLVSLYQDEWKRTFKNQVVIPCSSSDGK